MKLLHRQDDKW